MADNQQWPSEDEDFDAVHDGSPVTVSEASEGQGGGGTSVKVISHDEAEPAEEAAPASAPEAPAAEPETADSEPSEDMPPAVDEVNEASANEEPEVEAAAVPAPAAIAEPAPPARTSTAQRDKGNLARLVLEVILCIAVVGLALWAWTLRSDNSDLKKQVAALNTNPQIAIQKQTQALIDQVSKLIDLPKDETPTIANVSDAAKAKQQSAFFNNAQNGDKVLMYVKAGEAILYRPSTNKIILVAPLTFNNNASTTPTTSTTTKPSTTH